MQQHHVLLMSKRQRATSVQEQGEQRQKLPNILTPTFGDWKMINDSKAHPKISRRNPLFNKFGLMPKKAVTPSSCNHQNESIFRGLRSEEQSQRMKENYEDRVSTTETNNLMMNQFVSEKKPFLKIREMEIRSSSIKEQPRQLLNECQGLFENQKRVFENILRQNSLYSKYCKIIDKEQQLTNQKIVQIFHQYK